MLPDELIKKAQVEYFENNNYKQAEKLYIEAANLGSGYAAHELGVLYIVGAKGVKPNLEKSKYWLEKSLESGFEKTIATDPEWFKKSTT